MFRHSVKGKSEQNLNLNKELSFYIESDLNDDYTLHNNRNRLIWASLSFQAGLINAGGFLACHRFVTHTTGFATHFGVDLAQFKFTEALSMLLVPFFFLFGSMISAFYVDRDILKQRKPRYHVLFFYMCFFLALVVALGANGAFGVFGNPMIPQADFTLIALLCLCSGIQNAALSTASKNLVRTTHLTGLTTDLGIGLVRDYYLRNSKEKKNNIMRLTVIAAFVLGSAIGAFLFLRFEYYGFILPLFITAYLYFLSRKEWLLND